MVFEVSVLFVFAAKVLLVFEVGDLLTRLRTAAVIGFSLEGIFLNGVSSQTPSSDVFSLDECTKDNVWSAGALMETKSL